MRHTPCKAAVVQACPVLFDLEATLDKTEALTQEAARNGAQLVLFPEVFLPCYPRGLDFGMVVGSRTPGGREDWRLLFEQSVEVPGPATARLGAIAAAAGVWLVIGVTERTAVGGTLYCSLLYFSPDGQLAHRRRKLKPTGAERLIWGEGEGKDLQVLDTPFGKMGGLICWENYMPLARMALYEQGVEIYLAPTADHRPTWTATMQHIACEARAYVLGCNQFVPKSAYPKRFAEAVREQPDILSRGGSLIVSPLGEILAGPLFDEEGILYADLDGDTLVRSKLDFDAVGHYQRPDVFEYRWKHRN